MIKVKNKGVLESGLLTKPRLSDVEALYVLMKSSRPKHKVALELTVEHPLEGDISYVRGVIIGFRGEYVELKLICFIRYSRKNKKDHIYSKYDKFRFMNPFPVRVSHFDFHRLSVLDRTGKGGAK